MLGSALSVLNYCFYGFEECNNNETYSTCVCINLDTSGDFYVVVFYYESIANLQYSLYKLIGHCFVSM